MPYYKLVNLMQSPEERREKYAFLKACGVRPEMCRTMRDWNWSNIHKRIDNVVELQNSLMKGRCIHHERN